MKQIGLNIDIYAYCNPIVILGALGLLTWFSKLKIGQSKAINWIAASAFAVFLLHTNPNIGEPIYKNWILTIYNQYSGIECLALIAGFLICFFAAAILFDQPRKWLWQRMTKALPK